MKVGLKLARMGMNMEEATIVKWHKRPGEAFKAGDVLYVPPGVPHGFKDIQGFHAFLIRMDAK